MRWLHFISIGLTFYFLVILSLGMTFVPVELDSIRGLLSFNNINDINYINKYYDIHRDADKYYHFYKMLANSLQPQSISANGYSSSILSGYPIFLGIENLKGIGFYSGYLLIYFFGFEPFHAAIIGSDIALIFWTIVSLYLGFGLARRLGISTNLSYVAAITICPTFLGNSYEAMLVSMTGYILLAFSIVKFSVNYKTITGIIISILLISISNDFHALLYLPFCILFSTPWIIKKYGIKKFFLIMWIIFISLLISANHFLEIYNFLNSSFQNSEDATSLNNRNYHPLVFTAVFDWPGISFIRNYLLANYPQFNSSIKFFLMSESLKIALIPSIIILSVLISNFKTVPYKFELALMLLFWLGPLHYIFSLILSPLGAETSVRFHVIFSMYITLLAFYTWEQRNINHKNLNFLLIILLSITIVQFILITYLDTNKGLNKYWLGAIPHIVALFVFLITNNKNKSLLLIIAFLIIPINNGIGFSGNQALRPVDFQGYNDTAKIFKKFFNKNDKVLFLSSEGSPSFHPNIIMEFGIDAIDAYLVPYPNNITKLNWYHRAFYDETIIDFNSFLSEEVRYADITRTLSVFLVNNKLSEDTKNFVELTGITKIVLPSEIYINDPQLVFNGSKFGISVYDYDRNFQIPSVKCKFIYTNGLKDTFHKMKKNINKPLTVMIDSSHDINLRDCNEKKLEYDYLSWSDNEIEQQSNLTGTGIIITPYRYDEDLFAFSSTGKKLQTIECNIALTCVIMTSGIKGGIVFKYLPKTLWKF